MKITKALLILMLLTALIVVGCSKSDEDKTKDTVDETKDKVTKEAGDTDEAKAKLTKEAEKSAEAAKGALDGLGK